MVNGVSLEATESLRVSSAAVIGLEVQSMGSAIAAGLQTQYVATAYLTDGTSFDVTDNALIQWQSNQPGIASVSNQAGWPVWARAVTLSSQGTRQPELPMNSHSTVCGSWVSNCSNRAWVKRS